MNDTLREAIAAVVEAGLIVTNPVGGYIVKHGELFIHQLRYRSTCEFATVMEAVESFADEANPG